MKNPGSQVTIGYFVEIYATDYPKQKWVMISTVGTGFSLGIPMSLSSTNRGFFLDYAYVAFGPRNPDDGFLERMAPESKNEITNVTNSAGFGVGVEASAGFEGWMLTGSLGVSANWDWSTSTSVDMQDYVVRSYVYDNRARWAYLLQTVGDGVYYYSWESLINGDYLHLLPPISYTSLPVHNQAVWRFDPNDTRTIIYDISWRAETKRVYKDSGKWWAMPGEAWDHQSMDINLNLVTHERPPIIPKPKFITTTKGKNDSDDLAFYRPGDNTIYYLKSKGDGEYEVIETEIDFDNLATQTRRQQPKPPKITYLARHIVKKGENLSFIAYKYYQSAARSKWMRIYNENRAVIGGNPGLIRPGMQLNIPFKDGPLSTNKKPRG